MALPDRKRWRGGEIVTADLRNTGISDYLDALAGRDGVVQLEGSLEVEDGADGDHYVLVPTDGGSGGGAARIRFYSTDSVLQFHNGTNWVDAWEYAAIDWFGELDSGGDVGTSSGTLAQGSHSH